jgi:processed acidic surface protein
VFNKLLFCLLSVQLICTVTETFAAPPEDELNHYLSEIGWTKKDLTEYLNFYEISLAELDSVAEVKNFLGTPINSENYQALLIRYGLTDKQMKNLLNHFGDSLDEYKFVEDLDSTVGFYLNHADFMAAIETELKRFGITKQEAENFFQYLSQVEENNRNQLDQLQALNSQMETFLDTLDSSNLTDKDTDEIAKFLTEAIDLYDIKVNIKSNNQDISLYKLLKMKEPPGNLFLSIYSNTGKLLVDFIVPSQFFDDVISGWDEMIDLGMLSDELVDYLHEEKYNDANIQK